jgi:serine/threonine-protein kinase RsbW
MISASYIFRMSIPPDGLDTVHGVLAAVWQSAPGIQVEDRFRFETAIIELAANVIRYAAKNRDVTCVLAVDTSPERIEAVLEDTGDEADVDIAGRKMPDPEELAESGRGIALVKALVDELHYDRDNGTNRWRISRRLTR